MLVDPFRSSQTDISRYYVRKPSALAASARIQQRFLASHNVENETNEPDAVEGSGPGNPTDIVARPQTQGACAMQ